MLPHMNSMNNNIEIAFTFASDEKCILYDNGKRPPRQPNHVTMPCQSKLLTDIAFLTQI